jgi:hypothetical protein
VGNIHNVPVRVIEIGALGVLRIALQEAPSGVKAYHRTGLDLARDL